MSTTIRQCYVRLHHGGVKHSVEVWAASVMEAAALALQHFRSEEWSRDELQCEMTLWVEVRNPTFYEMKISDVDFWLLKNKPRGKVSGT